MIERNCLRCKGKIKIKKIPGYTLTQWALMHDECYKAMKGGDYH